MFIIFIVLFTSSLLANEHLAQAPYKVSSLQYHATGIPEQSNIKVQFFKDSVRWIRDKHNILSPETRILVTIPQKNSDLFVSYRQNNFIPTIEKEVMTVDLWVNLFFPSPIIVTTKKVQLAQIKVLRRPTTRVKERHTIDKSCIPYSLNLSEFKERKITIGCKVEFIGEWHKKKKRVTLSYSLVGQEKEVKHFTLRATGKVSLMPFGKISATFKSRQPRLKTAFGFGPYQLDTLSANGDKSTEIAPAVMLYGRYDLVNKSSLRFFDALVTNESLFNNGGLYFAYELISIYDNRISITPLLGAQILTFKYDRNSQTNHNIIYPQGLEITLSHTFGIKNLTSIFGMFLSNSETDPYTNLWIRTGKKLFYELNYIKWGNGTNEVRTYGLSIGMPLVSFF